MDNGSGPSGGRCRCVSHSVGRKISLLLLAIERLQKQLTNRNERYNELYANLSRTFSKAQLQKLQSGKRMVWQQRDLRDSCGLYVTSPSVYNMLLKRGYPLPSERTLQLGEATKPCQEVDDDSESCSNRFQIECEQDEAQQVKKQQQEQKRCRLLEAI